MSLGGHPVITMLKSGQYRRPVKKEALLPSGGNDMDVRFATPADIPDLLRLRFDFFDDDPVLAVAGEKKDIIAVQLMRYFEAHLNRDFFAALAIVNGIIAAVSFLAIHEKPANYRFPTGKTAEILNVFTYTEYRFNGYATATLMCLIDKAKQENASFIELSATSSGKPVYEKLGFDVTPPGHNTEMILTLV